MSMRETGRELDALIAEKVMGITAFTHAPLDMNGMCRQCWRPSGHGDDLPANCVPDPYSTDIAAAWRVVEELYHRKFVLQLQSPYSNVIPGHWKAMFAFKWINPETWENEINNHFTETAPHAICLAALKAVVQ